MPINFTRNDFILNTQKAMRAVIQHIEDEAYNNGPDLLKQLLEAFKTNLEKHYYQRQPRSKNHEEKKQKAEQQTKKIFSEFLQYLFHSTVSHHANQHNELLKSLLADYRNVMFLPDPDNTNEINVWIDLWETGGNCLGAICGTCDETLVEATLTTAYLAFVRKNTGLKNSDLKGYRKFLSLPNKEGYSPLQIACKTGRPKVVALLLGKARGAYEDNGAEHEDFLTKPKDGLSPLHLAILSGSAESVAALLAEIQDVFLGRPLQLQACLEQKNGNGETLLQAAEAAVKGGSKKHEDIVQLLTETLSKADTAIKNATAQTIAIEQTLVTAQEEKKAAEKEVASLKVKLIEEQAETRRIRDLLFDGAQLQSRVNILEKKLNSTQNELATTKDDLVAVQNELATTKNALAIAQRELAIAQQQQMAAGGMPAQSFPPMGFYYPPQQAAPTPFPLPPSPAIYPNHATLFRDAQGRVWAVAPHAQPLQQRELPGMGDHS